VATDPAPSRGEVWLTAFDPSIGGEIQKTRPAIIISNDAANAALNRVQVVPVSSQTDRLYLAEAYITPSDSAARLRPTKSPPPASARLLRRLGALTKDDLDALSRDVRLQLDLRRGAMTLRLRDAHRHKTAASSSGAAKSAHRRHPV
jgi:mRNA interferase MazF